MAVNKCSHLQISISFKVNIYFLPFFPFFIIKEQNCFALFSEHSLRKLINCCAVTLTFIIMKKNAMFRKIINCKTDNNLPKEEKIITKYKNKPSPYYC